MNGKAVSVLYFNHLIFLFVGGFLLALAMQKWNLHKRIALRILLFSGTNPTRILLGYMAVTWVFSMWVSNTATAMLMVPLAIAVIKELEGKLKKKQLRNFSVALCLGIAYSASIGGVATLVGTPPNLSFSRIFSLSFPGHPDITFGNWFAFALPLSVIFFMITWAYLALRYTALGADKFQVDRDVFKK
ncbi:MAG: sodium-dependent dicarboxylate transporter 2/3/5 [Candidatus Marinamargulisbacteria bacterium]|jgi:sodium-dependent dicarboxylate transporter 2/3/5